MGEGEYSRGKRDLVPLHTSPPSMALGSNSAPALLLMAQPGFRNVVFFRIRERLPQTSYVCSCACFSFFLTSLWVNAERLKRRAGKYKGGCIHTSDLQKGLCVSNCTANPLPQPGGTEKGGSNHSHKALRPNCQFCPHHAPFSSVWTMKYNISV